LSSWTLRLWVIRGSCSGGEDIRGRENMRREEIMWEEGADKGGKDDKV